MIGGGFAIEHAKPRPKRMYAVAERSGSGGNHAAMLPEQRPKLIEDLRRLGQMLENSHERDCVEGLACDLVWKDLILEVGRIELVLRMELARAL